MFRRWLRLYLPCWIIGILSLFQFWFGLIRLPIELSSSFPAQVWDYIRECERFANPFTLERDNFQVLNQYNPTMWTIPMEWAGSLLVFGTLLGVCRIRNYRRRTVVVAAISIYACISAQWNYWLFSTGILLGDYVRQAGGFERLSNRMTIWSRMLWAFVLLLGGLLGGVPGKSIAYDRPGYEFLDGWTPRNWQEIEAGDRFWWCWGGIFMITGISHFAALRRLFERPFARYLGRISFMLYLTHRMVGEIVGNPIRLRFAFMFGTPTQFKESESEIYIVDDLFASILMYLVSWVVQAPLALFLANWMEVLVDGPCTRFARKVDDKFTSGFQPDIEHAEEEELVRLPT